MIVIRHDNDNTTLGHYHNFLPPGRRIALRWFASREYIGWSAALWPTWMFRCRSQRSAHGTEMYQDGPTWSQLHHFALFGGSLKSRYLKSSIIKKVFHEINHPFRVPPFVETSISGDDFLLFSWRRLRLDMIFGAVLFSGFPRKKTRLRWGQKVSCGKDGLKEGHEGVGQLSRFVGLSRWERFSPAIVGLSLLLMGTTYGTTFVGSYWDYQMLSMGILMAITITMVISSLNWDMGPL